MPSPTSNPTLAPTPAPEPSAPPAEVAAPHVWAAADVDATLQALMATGCGVLEALGTFRDQMGTDWDSLPLEALPIAALREGILAEQRTPKRTYRGIIDDLNDVARHGGDRLADEVFASMTDLELHEDLDCTGCSWLRRFPAGFHFHKPEEESWLFKTEFDLCLSGCENLESFPNPGMPLSSLNLEGCWSLKALPEGLDVTGDLNLSGCDNLERFPTAYRFGRDVNLEDTQDLASKLPEGFTVGGGLRLGRSELKELPKELRVEGLLDVRGCPNWNGILPEGAAIGSVWGAVRASWDGTSAVRGTPGLKRYDYEDEPNEFFEGAELQPGDDARRAFEAMADLRPNISTVEALDRVAARFHNPLLHVRSNIGDLDRNQVILFPMHRVMEQAQGMEMFRDLDLSGRAWLTRLPDDLTVKGDLNLSGCANLTHLPRGLVVTGQINLVGTNLWDQSLPADAKVGKGIVIDAEQGRRMLMPAEDYRVLANWFRAGKGRT